MDSAKLMDWPDDIWEEIILTTTTNASLNGCFTALGMKSKGASFPSGYGHSLVGARASNASSC